MRAMVVHTLDDEITGRTKTSDKQQTVLAGQPPMRSRTLLSSFGHAFQGLRYALRTQRNARIHLTAGIVVFGAGALLGLDWLELAIITLSIALVFLAELLNTVTETVVDLVTNEHHPLAKTAKDVAAGAVFWAAIGSVIVGLLIIGPHLLRLLRQIS